MVIFYPFYAAFSCLFFCSMLQIFRMCDSMVERGEKMSECTKVITLQKDLHHPEAVHLDMLTMKRNYVRENYPLHIHDHYEMELVVSGEGWQWLNGEQHPLCPGMLYILSPEDVHRFAAQQPLELICLHLDGMAATPELLGLLQKCHGGAMVQLAEKNYALVLSLLNDLYERIHRNASLVQQRAWAVLTLLLTILLGDGNHYGYEHTANQPALAYLRQALAFIGENYQDKLTLQDAASSCNLSACYFSSIFTQYVGVPFSSYLMDLRLRHARLLLRQTSMSVTQVAFDSGFSSLSNFLRAFHRHVGCTPKEYRKMAELR